MRPHPLTLLLRGALLVAIVASAALFVDYQHAAGPSFCGIVSGCAEVRGSAYSHPFGIAMPTWGLGTFLGLFLLSAWASTRRHLRWLALFCTLSALGGLGLIYLMAFVIRALCPWCTAVDSGILLAAVASLLLARRKEAPEPEPTMQRALWSVLALVMALVPVLWGRDPTYQPPPPDVVAMQVPGKVTLVVFTDFECPFCQALHPVVDDIADKNRDKVRVKLVMMPLPIHFGADQAARVYLCTDDERKPKVAHALYSLPYEEITNLAADRAAAAMGLGLEPYVELIKKDDPGAVEQFKKQFAAIVHDKAIEAGSAQGLDRSRLVACMAEPQTTAELDGQIAAFRRTGLEGLPSTYVSNFIVQGADEEGLRAALKASLAGGGRSVRWMFALLAGLFLMTVALTTTGARAKKPRAASKGAPKPR
jgi:uncharacterized membrane protein/protein-disulfide isomerase